MDETRKRLLGICNNILEGLPTKRACLEQCQELINTLQMKIIEYYGFPWHLLTLDLWLKIMDFVHDSMTIPQVCKTWRDYYAQNEDHRFRTFLESERGKRIALGLLLMGGLMDDSYAEVEIPLLSSNKEDELWLQLTIWEDDKGDIKIKALYGNGEGKRPEPFPGRIWGDYDVVTTRDVVDKFPVLFDLSDKARDVAIEMFKRLPEDHILRRFCCVEYEWSYLTLSSFGKDTKNVSVRKQLCEYLALCNQEYRLW